MAYALLAKDGRPIMKDGDPVKAMDVTIDKIEQLDETNKSFIATASTEDEDRDKDIIRQDGWNLKNFKKNPMIPWSHDYWGIPVAKSLRTWVDKATKKLLFKPQFDSDDETSMKIFGKYKNGFLTSFSVGFRGTKFEYRDEEDRWWGGIEFLEQELLEISAVTIPANPNATVSVHGDTDMQNLLQLGFSQQFAETKEGLFYPVREMGEYVNPDVKAIEDNEDVQAVYAHLISGIDEKGVFVEDPIIVGYYFDPEWETEAIKSWITENNEPTYKHIYYDMKYTSKKKDFEIKEVEEDKELPNFDEPIKVLTNEDVPGDKDDDNDNDADAVIELAEKIEKIMTDNMEKLIDGLASAFDQVFDKILVELDGIKKLITEKELDLDDNLDDNDDDDDDDANKSNSKNDDDIEIDDSLISPDDDKSNSDDDIEIEIDDLESKDIADTVNSVFRQKLKETFKSIKEKKSIN